MADPTKTDTASGLYRDEHRAGIERQVREGIEFFVETALNAAAMYQRDYAQVATARCAEREPRLRQRLAELEVALRQSSDTARAAGDLAASMVDAARTLDSAMAALQTALSESSR